MEPVAAGGANADLATDADLTPDADLATGAGPAGGTATGADSGEVGGAADAKPESKGRRRFKKWLVRFGVPGASLLGPLAIPTHFTAAMLIASGTSPRWVLLWQAVAIVTWTTLTVTLMWLAVNAVVLA